MNKKLLAIAVGAAMVAGTTVAMADATVYGKINMGIVNYDDGDSGAAQSDGIGMFDEASRLGVKGSADLGNGMKAVFKMEGAMSMDNAGTTFWNTNRDKYVGLKGGFGQVVIGTKNTSFKNATGKMDLFADMLGDMTGNGFGSFDSRESNMIQYTNKFGMVDLSVDVDFAEANSSVANPDADAMGNSIAVVLKPMKGVMASLASATKGGTTAAGNVKDSAIKLGVQWKGGPHKVNFVYKDQKDDSTPANDQTVMYGQYGFTMGMNVIQLAYQQADREGANANSTQTSIAFVNNMSKKTKVYVAYTAVANDTNANSVSRIGSISIPVGGITNDSDPTALGVGITHNF